MFPIMTACKQYNPSMKETGFTLLEIMVSLVIISVVMVSLFRIQAGSLDLATSSRFKGMAFYMAARQLVQIEQNPLEVGVFSGEFDGDFGLYKWTCTISDFEGFDSDLISRPGERGLKKLEIQIAGPDDRNIYELTTYRYAGD